MSSGSNVRECLSPVGNLSWGAPSENEVDDKYFSSDSADLTCDWTDRMLSLWRRLDDSTGAHRRSPPFHPIDLPRSPLDRLEGDPSEEEVELEVSDLGMTPTPSKIVPGDDPIFEEDLIPTPSLDGLLDDALPEPVRGGRWSESLPNFASPQEAAAYLAKGRGDLDLELQRRLRSFTSGEAHIDWVSRHQRFATLSEDCRRFALNALVAEAAQRALRSRRLAPAGRKQCLRAWHSLMQQVTSHHEIEGAQGPQRNLSCMCMFSPQLLSAYPPQYGDASPDSHNRIASQMSVLRALGLQRALGCTSLFLRPDAAAADDDDVPFMISMA